MALRFIDYKTAVGTKNRYANWHKAADRLRPEAWPRVSPTFSLDRGATILTIGSCFARSIEAQFRRLGFKIPTLMAGQVGPSSSLNKFTPPSISQEIAWAAGIYRRDDVMDEDDCHAFCYTLRNGLVIDNNLADFEPLPYEAFIERRRAVYHVFRHAFFADCIVLTPGLAEAWHDRERGIFIQRVPTGHHSHISRNLQFTMLDFRTCFDCLDQAVSDVRSLNPNAKFLITTSPIPLEQTFTRDDVIIANTHAKSVLRAACGELVEKWEGVDYFPSFESVTLTRDWGVMAEDGIHVGGAFVKKIVNRTVELYIDKLGDAEEVFEAALAETEMDKAIGEVGRAIALAPNAIEYRLAVHALHSKFGDVEGAIEAYDQAVDFYLASGATSHPRYAAPEAKLLFRQTLYEQKGNLEKERDALTELVKVLADSAFKHFRLGVVLRALNDFEGSEAPLLRAWELKTYDPLAVGMTLAETWMRVGKPTQAVDLLLDLIEEQPDDTRLWTILGNGYLMSKNFPRAAEAFARAVEVDPNNAAASYNLGKLREIIASAGAPSKAPSTTEAPAGAPRRVEANRQSSGPAKNLRDILGSFFLAKKWR